MDKRFLVVLGVSAAVMIIWFQVVVPLIRPPPPVPTVVEGTWDGEKTGEKTPREKNGEGTKPPSAAVGPETGKEKETPKADPAPDKMPPGRTQVKEEKTCVLETDEIRAEFTNRGAALLGLSLKKFMDPFLFPEKSEPFRILRVIEKDNVSCSLVLTPDPGDLRQELWQLQKADSRSVTFFFDTGTGFTLHKRFFLPDEAAVKGPVAPFFIGIEVEILAADTRTETDLVSYEFVGPAGISPEFEAQGRMLHGFAAGGIERHDPTVVYFDPGDIFDAMNHQEVVSGTLVHWMGVANKYFGAVLVVDDPETVEEGFLASIVDSEEFEKSAMRLGSKKAAEEASNNIQAGIRTRAVPLKAGSSLRHTYLLYVGPKEKSLLRTEHFDISGIMDVSYIFCLPQFMVAGLGNVILGILDVIDSALGNYGLAIILMTIFVKLMLLPLSIKQQVSMADYQRKMKKVQPMLAKAKEKYKNDRQKQTQETMKIMKENNVSYIPFKGCLPIFLQFPIFIALFYTLRFSIELRHEGFLWISDLARPDALFPLPDFVPSIPLLGGFIGPTFNLLPIVWIGLMLVQQKFSPMKAVASDDPQAAQQQKMMTIMMAVFGVLFFQIESGCVLYIIISTIVGIGEQQFIRRKFLTAEA
jgi:YidC/Oxa1 family membrane protein insertase